MNPPPPPEQEQQARCCLLVLCGIPACGKSTVAAALAAAASAAGIATAVIDFDAFSSSISSEESGKAAEAETFQPGQWKAGREAALSALRSALQLKSVGSPQQRRLVIADDTMHYRSMRGECWRLARETGVAHAQLHIACPLLTTLQRNSQRQGQARVPEHVVERTAEAFETPEESPCLWDKGTLLHESTPPTGLFLGANEGAGALWDRVYAAWGPPLAPLVDAEAELQRVEAARQVTAEDALHAADVETRRQLSQALGQLQGVCAQDKARMATELNAERRRLLKGLRQAADGGCSSEVVAEAQHVLDAFQHRCRVVLQAP